MNGRILSAGTRSREGFTPLPPGLKAGASNELHGFFPPPHPAPLETKFLTGPEGRGVRVVTGFTLIELIVVVAIISILTALGLVLVNDARTRSRDVRREQNIKSLQHAITLYAVNNRTYPTTGVGGEYLTGTDPVSTALLGAGTISTLPRDPLNTGNYRYHYLSTTGTTYTITYWLETGTVPGKGAGEQQVGP